MPTTTTAPPKGGLKKLGALAGIAAAPADKAKRTEYPRLPDDPEGSRAALAKRIIDHTAELEAIEGALAIDKAEIVALAREHWFEAHAGLAEAASSVAVHDPEGREMLVTFTSKYKAAEEAALVAVIGSEEKAGEYFRQKFELKINGDAIPEDKADELLTELQALFQKHGAAAALTAKAVLVPKADFHTRRHRDFTPAENLDLERVSPMTAMVKTKGRGGAAK